MTRQPFAHDARLVLTPGGDDRVPGGAITVALCGSWSHVLPCPLAPHHTGVERSGADVPLRVLSVAEPEDEAAVRARVEETLARGHAEDPAGRRTGWRLVSSGSSAVRPDELDHARRLAAG